MASRTGFMNKSTPESELIFNAVLDRDLSQLQNLHLGETTIVKDWDTPLLLAIENGWMEGIRWLIQSGCDVNYSVDSDCPTPLGLAVELGQIETVNLLLQAGANPNGWCDVPLITAIWKNDLRSIELLLQAGADVDCCNTGVTPLLVAVKSGNLPIVELLVRSGACVNTECNYDTEWGCTPLMVAAKQGNLQIAQFLVQAGARVNAECFTPGVTALYDAATSGNQEVFDYLFPLTTSSRQRELARQELSQGIVLKQRREDKLTSGFIEAARRGDVQRLQDVIEAGVDIRAFGERGVTALHEAASGGEIEIIQILLALGVEPDIQSEGDRSTPLREAVSLGWDNAQVVTTLIEAGANPHLLIESWTLLMTAVNKEKLAVAKALIDAGVDVNATTSDGTTALEIARRTRNAKMVQLLKDAGAVGDDSIPEWEHGIPF
jgi:uncharacterized protein